MELANIEKLLKKYLDATTTLKEEKMLREYFASNNVAPHLQEYGIMFGYFKENLSETFAQTIKLNTKNNRKKNFKWLSVAAAIALLISSVFVGKQEYNRYQQMKQFEQIKETLQMVSVQLNKGNDELYAVSNNLTKGNEAINKLSTFPETINTANQILKIK